MKLLELKHDYELDSAKLEGKFPDDPEDQAETINEDVKVVTPDGILIAVFLSNVIPWDPCKLAFEFWKNVKGLPTGRPMAMGGRSQHRSISSKDGTLSPRKGVNARQAVLLKNRGAREGNLGHLGEPCDGPCRTTRLTRDYPEMLETNKALIRLVNSLYREHAREVYEGQRAEVKKAPGCRLGHTAFSSIYILKNCITSCHYDKNNLLGALTAIIALGDFEGGALMMPRWGIKLAYKPGDLVLFNPQQLHGVLPFEGERISAAFYCARQIAQA
jgi:hypothetical protein